MNPELLRKSVKVTVAAFITAAIATYFERIEFVWYPLLAVVIVVDDDDEKTVAAARNRILGTITGGLVTFLVHTVLDGWIGVLVSILLMVPVLRMLGWQSGLSTAALVSILFLMIPSHAALNWTYVFNRALDTTVGCVVALVVGLWMWPRNRLALLARCDADLRGRFVDQLGAYRLWCQGLGPRPKPLAPAPITADLERMDGWLQLERRGPHRRQLLQLRWPQRLQLWRRWHLCWLQWERLLQELGPGPLLLQSLEALGLPWRRDHARVDATALLARWQQVAMQSESPLAVLAVAAELQALLAYRRSLALLPPLP